MADEMMLIPKADLVAGYDAIRAKGVPGLIKSGELAGKIASIQGGAPNGTKWKTINSEIDLFSGDVKYSGGHFVIGANNGAWVSENGIDWRATNLKAVVRSLAVFGGLWIAATEGQGMMYSEDGSNWVSSNKASGAFYDVRAEGNVIVAGGEEFTDTAGAWYSEDGKTWTKSSLDGITIEQIRSDHGFWFAAGSGPLYYSQDGKTWGEATGLANRMNRDAVFFKGKWYGLTGERFLASSSDGKAWSPLTAPSGVSSFECLEVKEGAMFLSGGFSIFRTENGTSWTRVDAPEADYREFAEHDGLLFALAYVNRFNPGGVFYSSDKGKTWRMSDMEGEGQKAALHFCSGAGVNVVCGVGNYYSKAWEPS